MTVIRTENGPTTMEKIFIDQGIELARDSELKYDSKWFELTKPLKVYDTTNVLQSVTKLYDNGVKPCVRFKIDGKDVFCTPGHKFNVIRGNSTGWIQASYLKQGDIIQSYIKEKDTAPAL
jgi:hypothetical protein